MKLFGKVLFVCLFFGSFAAFSKDESQDFEKIYAKIQSLSLQNKGKSWAENYKTEELLRELFLKMPETYKQYIIPSLFTKPFISEKTLSHPLIRKWRGKKPTRIAPELQEYAEKYLDDLPPSLYVALMPEAWPSFYKGKKETVFKKKKVDLYRLFREKKTYTIPSVSKKLRRFVFPKDDKTPLTEKEVSAVMNVAQSLKSFSKLEEFDKKRATLTEYTLLQGMQKMVENSCSVLIGSLDYAGYQKQVSEILAKQNLSREAFVPLCNRTLRAYRVAHLPLQKAIGVGKIRREIYPNAQGKQKELMGLFLSLYTAPLSDVKALSRFKGPLFEAFTENRASFLFLSVPLFLK
ncbi:MAG: hypothetical protein PHI50_04595 [Alphaproteobacteria bacterium]|nr:hypothetical protein [Alphaproteobacteria bacterium]